MYGATIKKKILICTCLQWH